MCMVATQIILMNVGILALTASFTLLIVWSVWNTTYASTIDYTLDRCLIKDNTTLQADVKPYAKRVSLFEVVPGGTFDALNEKTFGAVFFATITDSSSASIGRDSVATPIYRNGQTYPCGKPTQPAVSFSSARDWSSDEFDLQSLYVLDWDPEMAQGNQDTDEALLLSWILTLVGGLLTLIPSILCMCGCADCDDCDDASDCIGDCCESLTSCCTCNCCEDSKFERKVEMSRAQAQPSGDEGYTCAYGPGYCLGHFWDQLCGSNDDDEA
mmetsp:Transcript_369/g.513  ORF Transcript_369/g.513 Transcript_369/m.513 type:complete len:269 (-) Transcript_369:8-814(-)